MNIVIIGAGASGLACVVRLKQNIPSASVTLLEQEDEVGKKLLATGNGRCNLSNVKAQHNEEVIDFFSSIGLVTRTDDEGRVYPYSNQAVTVRGILKDSCENLGVNIITDCTVTDIDKELNIKSTKKQIKADYAVVASEDLAQRKRV